MNPPMILKIVEVPRLLSSLLSDGDDGRNAFHKRDMMIIPPTIMNPYPI